MGDQYRIEWSPAAIVDLEDIFSYVAVQDGVMAAENLHTKLQRRIQSLASYPFRCGLTPELKQIGHRTYRDMSLPPYRVFFRVEGKVAGIVGVLDARRSLEQLLVNRALEDD